MSTHTSKNSSDGSGDRHAAKAISTACVVVLDSPDHAAEYLVPLKQKVGMQWLMVDSGRYLTDILTTSELPIHMFVFDFTQHLTDRIKPYLKICQLARYREVPVLFLASEETKRQVAQILDRPHDRYVIKPIALDKLIGTMGGMLRRAHRYEVRLKCWLQLDGRTLEGYTMDLSSSGVQIVIADPILYPDVIVDIFFPDGSKHVRFQGRVRRKEKEAGAYKLGVQFQTYIEGPIAEFGDITEIDFSEITGVKPG